MAAAKTKSTKTKAKERESTQRGRGRPRGALTPDGATAFFAKMKVGDKYVESEVLEGGFNDADDAKATYQLIRNRLSPIFARLRRHEQYKKHRFVTHSAKAVATNGDIIVVLIVERLK